MNGWALWLDSPIPYEVGVRLQESVHARRVAGTIPDTLFVLQHRPTITLGRRGRTGHLRLPLEEYARRGLDLVRAGRGGDVTCHGPGQWVLYPILKLGERKADAHGYLFNLEEIALRTCADFGVEAGRREGKSGAWTAQGKIAAIGFHIRRWVSIHGMSFNVSNALDGFETIVPCGLTGESVTTLARILGDRCPALDIVRERLTLHAETVLQRPFTRFHPGNPWPEPLRDLQSFLP